jgi:hypothetical protein
MALQFSRGCPFDCEFCDITKLYGRVPRTKDTEQMLGEFELLYHLGWRGSLFLVDDNFIGNKRDALRLLPRLREWQGQRGYPFSLFTEASMNLAQVPELLESMSAAGFDMVFMGIESPNPDTLLATNKKQNIDRSGRSALRSRGRDPTRDGGAADSPQVHRPLRALGAGGATARGVHGRQYRRDPELRTVATARTADGRVQARGGCPVRSGGGA